jgi:membrane-associated phospholipid phosphatase
MFAPRKSWAVILITSVCLPLPAAAQDARRTTEGPNLSAAPVRSSEVRHESGLQLLLRSPEGTVLPHVVTDQKDFWTRPWRAKTEDINWFIPFAATTALMIGSDTSIDRAVPTGSTLVKRSQSFSNFGLASLVGGAGVLYFSGRFMHDTHARETGILGVEALSGSLLDTSLIKFAAGRERPYEGNGKGSFWRGGSSFPSDHAAAAWSLASVIAHEYPGPFTELLAYGAASAISVSRVSGQKHFASDVLIGSALGWYMGRQVYRSRHNPELSGAPIGGGLGDDAVESGDRGFHRSQNMGSPYVPVESWIYAGFERLVALGYVRSAYLGSRPWTRMECARLLQEAQERFESDGGEDAEAEQLYETLRNEFGEESRRMDGTANLAAEVDSVYFRGDVISGVPLRDGYHFGQTMVNDYGRPYGQGFNTVGGVTAHVVAGPLSIQVQGEYQHAPAVSSDPTGVLQATAAVDRTLPVPNGIGRLGRFRLVNGTVAVTHDNLQVSFGQQSLWLGPGEAGPLLFSNNAESVTMLRIDSVSPYEVPLLSRLMGGVRTQFFLGRLSGQQWEYSPVLFGPNLVSQPFLHGTKMSFHPTPNLEFGAGFTAQFGGDGNPFTWNKFLRTFYSHRVGIGRNPGKRISEFDFTYRVPGLRSWLEVYVDSMVIDEYSPLGSSRPAINPGFYLPRFPKLHKMDLRLEGVTTDLNVPSFFGPGAFYWDDRYRSGYTNNGNLIGSWVGRRGRGEQGWLTYHFSARNQLQLGYRHNSVDRAMLDGGGQQDFTLRGERQWGERFGVAAWVQYERWHFPTLLPAAQADVRASVEITYWPRRRRK